MQIVQVESGKAYAILLYDENLHVVSGEGGRT